MGLQYHPTWLASFLHSFPHLDLTFKEVNSTFNPQDARYREALVFWAALPILWLLLTLLLFLVYFCYRCCQRDVEKKQDVPCLKWSLAVLAIFTCGALGLGFYGNEVTHSGMDRFINAIGDSEYSIDSIKREIYLLQRNINQTVTQGIDSLKRVYENYPTYTNEERRVHVELSQKTEDSFYYAQQILHNVAIVNQRAKRVNMDRAIHYIDQYGYYRWLGTVILLAWMVALCLIILLGVGLSSKCTLLVFCAFGIFTLVLCWLAAGFHLGISVGLGDFCIAPDVFFQRFGSEQIEKAVVRYYVHCDPTEESPFAKALQSGSQNIRDSNRTLHEAKQLAIEEREIRQSELEGPVRTVIAGLNDASENLRKLSVLTDCHNLHKDYTDGIEAICYSALPGMAFLLLSAVITGLFFTVLVLLASKAWRHFTRGEKYSEYVYNTEERVPLQNVEDGAHYSYTRGRHGHGRETLQMQQRGSTPPPAYNSNTFYRTGEPAFLNHSIPDDQSDYARESIA